MKGIHILDNIKKHALSESDYFNQNGSVLIDLSVAKIFSLSLVTKMYESGD